MVNEVRRGHLWGDDHGSLTLRVLIVRRHLVFEEETVPDNRLHAYLPDKEFYVHLAPVRGEPRELRGLHNYTRGMESYQAAVERYHHIE